MTGAGPASGSTVKPASGAARKLPTRSVEKVWGRTQLPDPFCAPDDARIGEIWFEPPAEHSDLLVKYLFTSEKLSVQVHPSDDNALPGEDGKEECWLVLDAQPGAQLAIGFDEQLSAEQMESAAKDGSIEELLTWHDVSAGDIFYLPAGTVHAIGAGLTLVEVQQNSDTTFRLYDYGRPRELHLERAMAVADRGPYSARYAGTVDERGEALIDDRYFRLDRIEGAPNSAILANYPGAALVLPLSGSVRLKDSGECAGPGECLYVPDLDTIDFTDAQVSLLTRSK